MVSLKTKNSLSAHHYAANTGELPEQSSLKVPLFLQGDRGYRGPPGPPGPPSQGVEGQTTVHIPGPPVSSEQPCCQCCYTVKCH